MASPTDVLERVDGQLSSMRQYMEQTRIERLREQEKLRGVKWMRLPELLTGKVASSAISLGVNTGIVLGPEAGYTWALMALVVTGLTAGTTPDVVNLYLNGRTTGPIFWQFNGNNFGYTFGKLQRTLSGGETLTLVNSGTLAATGTITLSGELIEVPSEMLGKLAGGG